MCCRRQQAEVVEVVAFVAVVLTWRMVVGQDDELDREIRASEGDARRGRATEIVAQGIEESREKGSNSTGAGRGLAMECSRGRG